MNDDPSRVTFVNICADVAKGYEREAKNELLPARLRARYSIAASAMRDAVKALMELDTEWLIGGAAASPQGGTSE